MFGPFGAAGPVTPGDLPWATSVHGAGTLAQRPAAGGTNAGLLYLATDVAGGTLYRSNGAAWVACGAGVSAGGALTLTGDVTGSGSGTVATTIAAGVVTNAKLATVATATFKGRTTAGTGDPEDLTATQATALLNTFTSSLKGLAPSSGGGTTNFLRADGTWAAPSGTGTVTSVSGSGGTTGLTLTGGPITTTGTLTLGGTLGLAPGGTNADLSGTGPGVLRQTASGASVTVGQALDFLVYEHQTAASANGGSTTAGAWTTHPLSTEVVDTGGHGTLAVNQITLAAGTYRVRFSGCAVQSDQFQYRFQNVTDVTTVAVSGNGYTTSAAANNAVWVDGAARFTIAGSKTFELQYRVTTAKATTGLGFAAGWGTETYARVELWREVG
jgi:hypothetical protein